MKVISEMCKNNREMHRGGWRPHILAFFGPGRRCGSSQRRRKGNLSRKFHWGISTSVEIYVGQRSSGDSSHDQAYERREKTRSRGGTRVCTQQRFFQTSSRSHREQFTSHCHSVLSLLVIYKEMVTWRQGPQLLHPSLRVDVEDPGGTSGQV